MQHAIQSVMVKLQPRRVRRVHIDGARELTNEGVSQQLSTFELFCRSQQVAITVSSPHNHHQNPYSERGIRVLQDAARAVSIQMRVPSCFWDRLLVAVAYVTNRTSSSSIDWITPHQKYYDSLQQTDDNIPDNSHLRVIGSICVAYVEASDRVQSEKLQPRGIKAILLGYAGNHNYVLWALDGSRWLRTPNVVFYESVGALPAADTRGRPPEIDPRDIVRSLPPAVQRRLRHRASKPKRAKDLNTVDDDITGSEGELRPKRGRPKKTTKQVYVAKAPEDDLSLTQALMERASSLISDRVLTAANDNDNSIEPNPSVTMEEALNGPDRAAWRESLFKEIEQLCSSGTITFVPNSGQNIITAKWVLRRKFLPSGELEKLKSRLVARGFTQRYGIDYYETTSTTARTASWRILLALATLNSWKITQIDVVGAYLLGELDEQIFMKQFPLLEEFFAANPTLAEQLSTHHRR